MIGGFAAGHEKMAERDPGPLHRRPAAPVMPAGSAYQAGIGDDDLTFAVRHNANNRAAFVRVKFNPHALGAKAVLIGVN